MNLSTVADRAPPPRTEEWFIWPREWEGNVYAVNWSLNHDGIVPTKHAYRNGRVPILNNRLGYPASATELSPKSPSYFGPYKISEAGEHISHNDFTVLISDTEEHLSAVELFVEDGALGAFNKLRLGTRVVTKDPAVALIFRNLLVY